MPTWIWGIIIGFAVYFGLLIAGLIFCNASS